MNRALEFGIERGCHFACVETMSFQAPEFYQKMGFTIEFSRPGYAENKTFHYLKKSLDSAKIRKKITRIGVYGVVMDEGKILVIRQQRGPYAGKLDFPGGGIEFGESPEQTLRRELLEEVAMEFDSLQLIDNLILEPLNLHDTKAYLADFGNKDMFKHLINPKIASLTPTCVSDFFNSYILPQVSGSLKMELYEKNGLCALNYSYNCLENERTLYGNRVTPGVETLFRSGQEEFIPKLEKCADVVASGFYMKTAVLSIASFALLAYAYKKRACITSKLACITSKLIAQPVHPIQQTVDPKKTSL